MTPGTKRKGRHPRADVIAAIGDAGIIPVVRADSPDLAVRVVETLVDAGCGVIEVTLTVPDAFGAIATLVSRLGGRVILGAGTVTDAASARRALTAGAEFLVSPCLVAGVVSAARAAGVAVLPGALTPTEIFDAVRARADLVKIFPAHSVGGPAYLRALRGPFPQVPFVPTGGVTLETIGDYFAAGAAAVGVGGELVPRDAVRQGDFAAIGAMAERFLGAVREARRGGRPGGEKAR